MVQALMILFYGIASASGHRPKLGEKQAKRAGPILKHAWPILKPVWHPPNPHLAYVKLGGGWHEASLDRNQARVPRRPKVNAPHNSRGASSFHPIDARSPTPLNLVGLASVSSNSNLTTTNNPTAPAGLVVVVVLCCPSWVSVDESMTDDPMCQEVDIGPVGLGYVPSPAPRRSQMIKPSGHKSNPRWLSVKRDLGLCPDALARPYIAHFKSMLNLSQITPHDL
ncbi:hypothetical protein PGT21_029075 [Puccinia graminis f. sp. tritici]|uniref:Uncharacterized protein n=1 Tax=Puccinia graminis f. sp. tritici TaxID=56615 RepID=A0A5B0PYX3_PUCGR|nr:hypothetical protein PGT21_029075 [Puccinia graminis f. sp. tritici]